MHVGTCWYHSGEREGEDSECRWCGEVADLKASITALRGQIGKTAIRVDGGEVELACGDIGLLEVRRGGSVVIKRPEGEGAITDGLEPSPDVMNTEPQEVTRGGDHIYKEGEHA